MTDEQRINRKLQSAKREVEKALDRAVKFTQEGGEFRQGHLVEMRRRLIAIRDEADKAIRAFGHE